MPMAATTLCGVNVASAYRRSYVPFALSSETCNRSLAHLDSTCTSVSCRVRGSHSSAKTQSGVSTSGRSDIWHENARLTSSDIFRDTATSTNASMAESSDLLHTSPTTYLVDDVALREQGADAMLASSANLTNSTYIDNDRETSGKGLRGSGHVHAEVGPSGFGSNEIASALDNAGSGTWEELRATEANSSLLSDVVGEGMEGVEAEKSASHRGASFHAASLAQVLRQSAQRRLAQGMASRMPPPVIRLSSLFSPVGILMAVAVALATISTAIRKHWCQVHKKRCSSCAGHYKVKKGRPPWIPTPATS